MSCTLCGSNVAVLISNEMAICSKCKMESIERLIKYEDAKVHKFIEPTEVLPNLYIGPFESCVSIDELKKRNITNVIIAGKLINKYQHDGIEYLELLIDDSLEEDISYHFVIANKFINDNNTGNTLVYCYSGISRSASIIISYLMEKMMMTYDEAFAFLKEKKANIQPNSNFEEQLRKRSSNTS
jgi:hypothetical protein